jgi:hypothetical protein
MNIVDWFDPHNIEHINAYKHLESVGHWPKGFIPKDIIINSMWPMQIREKMCDAWMNYMCELYSTDFHSEI